MHECFKIGVFGFLCGPAPLRETGFMLLQKNLNIFPLEQEQQGAAEHEKHSSHERPDRARVLRDQNKRAGSLFEARRFSGKFPCLCKREAGSARDSRF